MVSLVDTVSIRGKEIEISGITAAHIVGIFYKFPEVRMLLTQATPGEQVVQTLIVKFPEAVALLIASACGAPDDDKAIAIAGSLNIGEQYEILEKVAKLTFPQGIQNFLDGAQKLFGQANGGLGWAPGMTLPARSNDASQQDETKTDAGTAPPDNSAPGSS
jgi:hypothetical protein